jgi:hypothetical protein
VDVELVGAVGTQPQTRADHVVTHDAGGEQRERRGDVVRRACEPSLDLVAERHSDLVVEDAVQRCRRAEPRPQLRLAARHVHVELEACDVLAEPGVVGEHHDRLVGDEILCAPFHRREDEALGGARLDPVAPGSHADLEHLVADRLGAVGQGGRDDPDTGHAVEVRLDELDDVVHVRAAELRDGQREPAAGNVRPGAIDRDAGVTDASVHVLGPFPHDDLGDGDIEASGVQPAGEATEHAGPVLTAMHEVRVDDHGGRASAHASPPAVSRWTSGGR